MNDDNIHAGERTPAGWYVHESGPPGAPAVVFLHGAGVSGRMWRKHLGRLADFHCLAPDLPGFGQSNGLPWTSRVVVADQVARLIETRIAAGRTHLIGLSLGGALAHTLLARHSDLLDRVVIDGSGLIPSWRDDVLLSGIIALSPFLHSRIAVAALGASVSMDADARADLRLASPQAFRRAYAQIFRTRATSAEMDAPCPTLLVAGEKEPIVRRSDAALASLMPHAEARFVRGLGHGWLGRNLELHIAMVEAWLSGRELPTELEPEVAPSPSDVARLRRESSGGTP